ncbi:MAG: nickel pincer cofactor biosynthesis protein LarC [Chloroflexota bacterium]|nr:nickel pincer cofactor biosynthesis protein LarC [Chloroflexota bacterium]
MTRILYVDCFSGVSGDMLLGALLDAGLPFDELRAELGKLPLAGYRLEVRPKQSHGIGGTKLDVLVDEAVQPERHLADILALLDASQLDAKVRATAAGVFRRLAVAEAKIHATSVDEVHFHEVGGVDSIVDIVGAAMGLRALGVEQVYASSLPLPGGTIRSRHGLLPAPAPATLEILAGVGAPTRPAPVEGELVTPTGAAILAEVARFEQPRMRVRRVGYGYGTKELPWPNAVRVWLGEAYTPAVPPPRLDSAPGTDTHGDHSHPHEHLHRQGHVDSPSSQPASSPGDDAGAPPAFPPTRSGTRGAPSAEGNVLAGLEPGAAPPGLLRDEVVVLETNLDDASPELLGYTLERLFEAGALDVYFTPIQMKKNRPGTLLGVIAPPARAGELAGLVLAETTTLGVRMHRASRLIAERRRVTVETPFGPVRVKQKLLDGRTIGAPEYEDCARLARQRGVPLAEVYRAATVAADIGQ